MSNVDPGNPFLGLTASDLGVPALFETAVDQQSLALKEQLRRLIRIVESPLLNLFLTGRPVRFSTLPPEGRERYLRSWSRSRLEAKRKAFHTVKRLTSSLSFAALPDGRTNPSWPAIGYHGPDDAERARWRHPAELRIEPLRPDRETTIEADVAVVGSGAGGAVIAAHAAQAGLRVVVLEAGGYHTADDFPQREYPGTDSLYDDHGLRTTKDLAISLFSGHAAGGGTTINWMTCLRPPPWVLEEWERVHGIEGLSGPQFESVIEEVEQRLGVNTGESAMTEVSDVLRRGCEALGYRLGVDYHVTPKNARGCDNRCDYCNWGCIYSARQSALVTYLPDAYRHGARFLFDTRADSIAVREGTAVGVEGTFRDGGKDVPVHIRAKVVVCAAGSLHTPALLLRSGLRDPQIGQHFRIHPVSAVAGLYDRPVRMWAGIPQTVHVDRWANLDGRDHGFWVETVPAHPGLTGLGAPWWSAREHKEVMRNYDHLATNIVLVRDYAEGRVTIDARGQPIVDYRMREPDVSHLIRGLQESARIHAAAGARSVWTLHTERCAVEARDGRIRTADLDAFLERIAHLGIRRHAIALFSAHLMGGCSMGTDPRRSAAKPSGEMREVRNLFVGDASVFPSAPGVNPMITIMAMARRTASFVLDALRTAS